MGGNRRGRRPITGLNWRIVLALGLNGVALAAIVTFLRTCNR